ncbi:MAG: CopD family protein, partial [Pseudomonadota bacterium]
MEGFSQIDGWAIAAIAAKASSYAATLLAIGGVLFVLAFPKPDMLSARQLATRIAVAAAVIGFVVLATRFGLRAARISGMGFSGAVDTMMLSFVWESPLGNAAIWRGTGFAAILLLPACPIGPYVAGAGALCLAVSFAFVGHALAEPRMVLGALVTLHVLGVGFWVGALAPLFRAASAPDGAATLHRFGVVAVFVVSGLALAGAGFALAVSGSPSELIGTAYGTALLSKLVVVTGLLALAAKNKLVLVPALARNEAGAPARLQRAIRLEGVAVA